MLNFEFAAFMDRMFLIYGDRLKVGWDAEKQSPVICRPADATEFEIAAEEHPAPNPSFEAKEQK